MSKNKKTEVLPIRLTKEEKEMILIMSEAKHMTCAMYLIQLVLQDVEDAVKKK